MEQRYSEDRVKVPFGPKHLDAAMCVPAPEEQSVRSAVILTHGAGGDMDSKPLTSLARRLAASGLLCLRFTCRGPNLAHRVKAFRAAWQYLRSLQMFSLSHIFIGGRSMGGRAAAALARQLLEESEDGLGGVICLSFPLHPPGDAQAHQQRGKDLRELPESVPVLFVSGTEDSMCDRALFEGLLAAMRARADVLWVEGGDHGLRVAGRAEDSILDHINSQVSSWIVKLKA